MTPVSDAHRRATRPSTSKSPWLAQIRSALAAEADATRATEMQAYMKSAMPFHGVPKPIVKCTLTAIFAAYPFDDPDGWEADVRGIFDGARFREEWYAALALRAHRRAAKFIVRDRLRSLLALDAHLVVGSSWWDIVDEVAAHDVGALLAAFPDEVKPEMRAWSRSDHMWTARTAILSQLRHGDRVDEALLFDCIRPSIDSKEFFLRKAIGWALREYSRRKPDAVRAFVRDHADRLSGLSKREALRLVDAASDGRRS